MRRILMAVFIVVALSGSATASSSTESAIRGSKGRYGDAGCGLGSLAFGTQEGAVQILAATTNTLFLTQTFGITTGTSNCSGISGGQATRIFIEANREALAKDISRGSGETIGTLTWLNGCTDSKAVGATLQKNFSIIFPSESVSTDDVTAAVIKTLKDEKMLACQNLG
ncbi:MAG TPA: DUF3015 family protein [Anaeromyxobacteraceae bacterium]|nr:DUF3015 family protein [Anaeromyxobacteraceae bacterium]